MHTTTDTRPVRRASAVLAGVLTATALGVTLAPVADAAPPTFLITGKLAVNEPRLSGSVETGRIIGTAKASRMVVIGKDVRYATECVLQQRIRVGSQFLWVNETTNREGYTRSSGRDGCTWTQPADPGRYRLLARITGTGYDLVTRKMRTVRGGWSQSTAVDIVSTDGRGGGGSWGSGDRPIGW